MRVNTTSVAGASVLDVVGHAFGPAEVVSVYVTFPDGRVFPAINQNRQEGMQPDQIVADGTGEFFFQFLLGALTADHTSPEEGVHIQAVEKPVAARVVRG